MPLERLSPAVAAVRVAVRRGLAAALAHEAEAVKPDDLVLVGCSGGPDSLALAAAVAFEAPKLGLRAGSVTVDHGLQAESAQAAAGAATTLRGLALDPVLVIAADVAERGAGPDYPGPEAAARRARYAVFELASKETGATAILLGHTMDDQAETVLLGLARGSGARSIAGMAPAAGGYLRPLLGLRRSQTVAACAALGLEPWHDPQNDDAAFTRTRVRTQLLPLMEQLIGPGVTESLARTAGQLRTDADALDDLTTTAAGRLIGDWPPAGSPSPRSVSVSEVADLPTAIRTRLLKRAAIAAGSPAGALTAVHVGELDALITDWHGQRWLDLPGGIRCQRRYGRLHFTG
ncbi:MAG TPA: tRNA lysidine(34) synthetase TilS [Streptosporangiaceae bacterium]